MNGGVQHLPNFLHPSLQDEIEDSSSRLLTDLCAILFASSGQLQQLKVFPADQCDGEFSLPRPLMGMISIASSLKLLTVDISYDHSITTLAESIPSLKRLKVHSSTLQLVCMYAMMSACLMSQSSA